MRRDAAITTRVDTATKEAIVALAKQDGRSESQYLERLILAHLRDKGIEPDTPRSKKP